MKKKYSHLLWLGAGAAAEPSKLIDSADGITLIEARSEACIELQKKFLNDHIKLKNLVVTEDGKDVLFTEYNLPEYSGIKPISGLKDLFPGIKAISSSVRETVSIIDIVKDTISPNNNILIIDIVDIGLPLLEALKTAELLANFSSIKIRTSLQSLYLDSTTTSTATEFLHAHGYLLTSTNSLDPDQPWLTFEINPLWQKIQEKISTEKCLSDDLNITRDHLASAVKELDNKSRQLSSAHNELDSIKNQISAIQEELDLTKKELSCARAEASNIISTATHTEEKKPAKEKPSEGVKELKNKKYGGDAQIDDFIDDIQPFFHGKFVTYADIGAFKGEVFEKLVNSKKLSIREAHLYEPNPNSFDELTLRVKPIKIASLHTNRFALGSIRGTANFIAAQSMTKMIQSKTPNISGDFQSEIHTFDIEIEQITDKHVHLLKIDAEGSEIDVLKGAEKSLKDHAIDVIYIEVGFNREGTQQAYMGEIDSFLQDKGYRVFKIYEQRNEWIEDSPLLRRCNFAYMSSTFSKSNPYKLTQLVMELKSEIEILKSKQS